VAWHGTLDLRYRRDGEATRVHDRHDGPLRVLRSFHPEGERVCHSVLVHPPGGIVGGDTLAIRIDLEPGAHALLTTPGATRFYRSLGETATQSLEGGAAGLVAKRIGKRLGLDEAGVEENEMIGGSALTIGEYLSPRLYLSYGVGLFQPGEVIALRYKLSHDVGVRIQRGTEETRAGVEYRIEK